MYLLLFLRTYFTPLPSQKQLRWSELKVGITVIVGSATLALLVFLISGTGGLFTQKITLITYFDNAEGIRPGQPVDLQGVAIGNVKTVRVVPGRPLSPVQVVMRVNKDFQKFIHEDSKATIETAGVLGESFVDISQANTGLIRRDLRDQATAQKTLSAFSVSELIQISAKAADHFLNSELPLGDTVQSPQSFIEQISATTGLPFVMVRNNMSKIHKIHVALLNRESVKIRSL